MLKIDTGERLKKSEFFLVQGVPGVGLGGSKATQHGPRLLQLLEEQPLRTWL